MPRGFVYRVAQGGDVEVLRGVAPQGVRVANGCAFSECGSSMYFVDSPVRELRFGRKAFENFADGSSNAVCVGAQTRTIQKLEYDDDNLAAISLRDPERYSSDPAQCVLCSRAGFCFGRLS